MKLQNLCSDNEGNLKLMNAASVRGGCGVLHLPDTLPLLSKFKTESSNIVNTKRKEKKRKRNTGEAISTTSDNKEIAGNLNIVVVVAVDIF